MRLNKLAIFISAVALAGAPIAFSPALAATAAEVKAGMQVVDPAGGVVGTVISVKPDSLILKTDKHEIQLPLTSFTANEGKLLFGMTAAQLDAATEKSMAAANAAIVAGAQVYGSDGNLAGQIETVDSDFVTIKLTNGSSVRLPRSGVAGGAKGAVLGMTAAKLNELAAQSTTQPASNGPSSSNGK
jgi:preprotein translocase subunit YajC